MKLKKPIILAFCVIVAALGITLTGCGNSSSDKVADSSAMITESSTDVRTESPEASAEPPAASAETPAASAETPAASAETPAASAETPAASAEIPAASAETPAADAESPDASAETPAADAESPAASTESPAPVAESPDASTENPYVGTWEATVVESSEGQVVDAAEALGSYEITFHADNTFSGVIGNETSGEGTWELTENGLRMLESNGVYSDFIYQDGELLWVIEMLDVKATCHFVKKQ